MEEYYDWLEIETETTKNRFWGSLEDLPPDLRNGQWFNTKSNFISLRFYSDGTFRMKGFKIHLLCQNEPSFKIAQGKVEFLSD